MSTLPQSPARRNPPRKPPSGVQGRTFALVRELRLLIETTRALASAHEPKSVLRVIFDKAKAFVRCEAWSLFLIDPSTHELVFDMVGGPKARRRSEEHTSELQSRLHLVCRLLLEKK